MEKVLSYFEKIMSIPRESGNEKQITDFLVNFANERNLPVIHDDSNNVIIKKNTAKSKIPLILQAHTDMVCVKDENVDFDFKTQGIIPVYEGDFLKAQGTSLGADNGIGLAMILSILDEDFPMNVECVFTTEEETGMFGAQKLDCSSLKGKHFLSLDGSDENVIETASAGMAQCQIKIETDNRITLGNFFKLKIEGLIGGHSGIDINKNRGNATSLLVETLDEIDNVIGTCYVNEFFAETKSNVLPSNAEAIFCCGKSLPFLEKLIDSLLEKIKKKIDAPDLKISLEMLEKKFDQCFFNTNRLINFLAELPNGVVFTDNENFPIVSANLFKIDFKNKLIGYSYRASDKTLEEKFLEKVNTICEKYGLKFEILASHPYFEFKEKSKLRDILIETHKKIFNFEPKITKVHAGLEGGIFAKKIKNLDICVIAPNIFDLHSTKERVSLTSVKRTYEWVKEIVSSFN